jgi:short-subunit dehydrogenase involved in D-alanine esterification of teichoic acids
MFEVYRKLSIYCLEILPPVVNQYLTFKRHQMSTPNLHALYDRKEALQKALEDVADRRSRAKTQGEKLKINSDAARITGKIADVEREIERITRESSK